MWKTYWTTLSKWGAIAGLALGGLWLRIPHTVQILIMLMGLDILSGLIAAISTRSINSSIMLRGIFRKLGVFPLLALLHVLEGPLSLSFDFEAIAALAFIVYEGMSIIENCARAGVPIPAVIIKVLVKAKVPTASVDEIRREFDERKETKVSVSESTEIIRTPDALPDLKVDTKVTTLEEKHIEPVKDSKPKCE